MSLPFTSDRQKKGLTAGPRGGPRRKSFVYSGLREIKGARISAKHTKV